MRSCVQSPNISAFIFWYSFDYYTTKRHVICSYIFTTNRVFGCSLFGRSSLGLFGFFRKGMLRAAKQFSSFSVLGDFQESEPIELDEEAELGKDSDESELPPSFGSRRSSKLQLRTRRRFRVYFLVLQFPKKPDFHFSSSPRCSTSRGPFFRFSRIRLFILASKNSSCALPDDAALCIHWSPEWTAEDH